MYEKIYDTLVTTADTPLPFELPEWIALAPFEEFIGMSIKETANGKAILTMPFKAGLCQGVGLMHGGAITSLADTALAIAIKTILPEGTHFATINLGLSFHSPIKWGTVTAIAVVTNRSERDIAGEVDVVTEEGIKAATFKATFRIGRIKKTE